MDEQSGALEITADLIRPINKYHDRKSFDCGCPQLNDFLVNRGLSPIAGSTYVLVRAIDSSEIVAYFTISPDVINILMGNSGKPLASLVKLEYLAVDKKYQNQGLGEELLAYIISQFAELAATISITAFVVEPLNAKAHQWFINRNFGFVTVDLPDRCLALFAETLVSIHSDASGPSSEDPAENPPEN